MSKKINIDDIPEVVRETPSEIYKKMCSTMFIITLIWGFIIFTGYSRPHDYDYLKKIINPNPIKSITNKHIVIGQKVQVYSSEPINITELTADSHHQKMTKTDGFYEINLHDEFPIREIIVKTDKNHISKLPNARVIIRDSDDIVVWESDPLEPKNFNVLRV